MCTVEASVLQAGKPQASNYLVAREIPLCNEDLPSYALDAHSLLAEMEGKEAFFNVLVLDCCRNNPLDQEKTRGLGGGDGQAFDPFDPTNSLVAYACEATTKAAERSGHGIFTKHLLQHISTPDQSIVDLFTVVGNGVEKDTRKEYPKKQRPNINLKLRVLTKDTCLVPSE